MSNGREETSLKTVIRGEVWSVNLDPTIGTEIRKTRPVIVVSSDAVGVLPIRLVAPLTEWKDHFARSVWLVKLLPGASNGLTKTSAVDTLQLRGVDTQRFRDKLGVLSVADMRSIVAAIAGVIEF